MEKSFTMRSLVVTTATVVVLSTILAMVYMSG
jgi:hypothetical protein